METFTRPRPLIDNPDFAAHRVAALDALDTAAVDAPLRDLISALNRLEHSFTLQCCWGHFRGPGEDPPQDNPPPRGRADLEYAVAYLALAVRDDAAGEAWLETLRGLKMAEPRFVQFGSADWFWERQINSYVLQVGPKKSRRLDRMTVDGKQARLIAHARTRLFRELAVVARGGTVQ
jgi:hypothetical protein